MAKLYFRYGAMNSGKSTALMQVAHNYEEQGMRVLILKPQVDTKGGGELVSRLGVRRKADLLIPPETDVFEAVRTANADGAPLACVLCDESQFFTAQQAEQLFMVTVDLNIPVICYGLRADFSLKGFPGSTRLLELAHTIEEMKTICTCGRKAICNCRKVNGRFVFEGEQVAIDLENDAVREHVPSVLLQGKARVLRRKSCFAGRINLYTRLLCPTTRQPFFFIPGPQAQSTQQRKICCCRCFFTPQKGEKAPISMPEDRCRMPAANN